MWKTISKTVEPLPNCLSQRLFEVMQASEVLWKAPFSLHKMVFKCAADIVVKAVRDIDDYTAMLSAQSSKVSQPLRYQMVVQETRPRLRLFVSFDMENIGPLEIPEPEFSYTSYKTILIRQQLQHTLCITRCLGLSSKSIIVPDKHDPNDIIKRASQSNK